MKPACAAVLAAAAAAAILLCQASLAQAKGETPVLSCTYP